MERKKGIVIEQGVKPLPPDTVDTGIVVVDVSMDDICRVQQTVHIVSGHRARGEPGVPEKIYMTSTLAPSPKNR